MRQRRHILSSAFLNVVALLLCVHSAAAGVKAGHDGHGHNKDIPPASKSGIDHVVVVMMENCSFDHLLGWLPNVLPLEAILLLAPAGFPQ